MHCNLHRFTLDATIISYFASQIPKRHKIINVSEAIVLCTETIIIIIVFGQNMLTVSLNILILITF